MDIELLDYHDYHDDYNNTHSLETPLISEQKECTTNCAIQ